MSYKSLAGTLTVTLILCQASIIPSLFAQADTDIEGSAIASVIQSGVSNEGSDLFTGTALSLPRMTPDIYMVNEGEGRLPTIVQALKQDETSASLYVNGTEVLRLRNSEDAYSRVKIIADRLNRILVTDAHERDTIEPAFENKMPVLRFGDEVLATADADSAQAIKHSPEKLAFVWSNQLRRALGQTQLAAKDYPKFTLAYRGTGRVQAGVASWYGPGFNGRRTASGTRFNMYEMTAAHRTLPFGTLVRVTNQRNKKSCVVKITDRGPYAHGRIIDLSKAAAGVIGMSGVAPVTVEVVVNNQG